MHLAPLAESLARHETWKLVARLTRIVQDVDLAEELAQDALLRALETWPRDGVPENPGAWLMATAKNRALDAVRKKRAAERITPEITLHEEERLRAAIDDAPEAVNDDRLRLVFVCCHPDLAREQQVALTLRLVAGLAVDAIARAFLAPESTIAQRLVRAKRTLREEGLLFEVPGERDLAARLPAVLEVIYLVFNEGYSAARGDALIRRDLCGEALRLGRALAALMPREPEVLGLVALMEIQDSRAATRVGDGGEIVLLADQDRARWDRAAIARGLGLIEEAAPLGRRGPYLIQAEIAACHARAETAEATNWQRISALYGEHRQIAPSPIIDLNRAVAVSMWVSPHAGLELLDAIDDRAIEGYHHLPAARADMLRRMSRLKEAAAEYERAIELVTNDRERAFLERRLADVEAGLADPTSH